MQPITPSVLVGRKKDEALKMIAEAGLTARVTFEDGKYHIGTREIDITRVNLVIKDGVIVNAALG